MLLAQFHFKDGNAALFQLPKQITAQETRPDANLLSLPVWKCNLQLLSINPVNSILNLVRFNAPATGLKNVLKVLFTQKNVGN